MFVGRFPFVAPGVDCWLPGLSKGIETSNVPHPLSAPSPSLALALMVYVPVSFQAWVQEYVDHGISSTINLPSWGSEANNDRTVRGFGSMLIRYLPKLRGITCYPDGARGGQPLVPVPYKEAIASEGVEFSEMDVCSITGGGSCGD